MPSTTVASNASTQTIQTQAAAIAARLSRGVDWVQSLGGAIPPSGLVLLSSFAVQIGVAFAKSMFDTLGAVGAAFLFKAFAALLLIGVWRPRWRNHRVGDYMLISVLGGFIALMSLSFYEAIARIPLGVASTIEFLGPLGVAVVGSRRPLDFLWVLMAATGLFLLTPLTGAPLDLAGVNFALISGGCWAGYILLSGRCGRIFPGGSGLAIAMAISAILLLPMGVADAGLALMQPWVLVAGLGIAFLGTLLPYSLEYSALRRMPPRVFGVLISIEPAIAAIVGFMFLHEQLGMRSIVAVLLVTTAAAGATWFGRSRPHQ